MRSFSSKGSGSREAKQALAVAYRKEAMRPPAYAGKKLTKPIRKS